MLPYIGEK